MPHLEVGQTMLELDDAGFLREPGRWNDEVAVALAAADGIPDMTSRHWKVVRYIRAHYVEHRLPPLIRKLCKQTGVPLLEIYQLFPKGPARGACRVAGLPSADGCV